MANSKKKCCYSIFWTAACLMGLLLVLQDFWSGATTISDRIPVLKPYTKWIFTDEGGTTQRVPQTHNISWHVPDDDMRSQEALWYPPEYNMSHNDDISMRSQFQKSAIDHYCSLYYQNQFKHHTYNKFHFLSDENHRVMFCSLPKVGCTNLKVLFFVNQGLLPRTELEKPREKLDKVTIRSALKRTCVPKEEQLTSIDGYFKFMMVRNPLERFLSAYRDKVEKYSLNFSVTTDPHFTWLRNDIFKWSHPELYMQWVENGMKPIQNSFYDFVNYWLDPAGSKCAQNNHFMPMVEVCKVCKVRYDFYGNFNHFDHDSQVLVDRIGGSSSDLRQGYYSEDSSTDQRMNIYYSTLTETQRIAVVKKLSLDLEFYYTLFPEERNSHKQLLNVTCDLHGV